MLSSPQGQTQKNIQAYHAANNPGKEQRQDPPLDVQSQAYPAWKILRGTFVACYDLLLHCYYIS